MDDQKDKRGGDANGGSQKGTDDTNQEETVRLPWLCTESKSAGNRLLIGNGGGKESIRKTGNEIYGCNQRTNWKWKDGRSVEIC